MDSRVRFRGRRLKRVPVMNGKWIRASILVGLPDELNFMMKQFEKYDVPCKIDKHEWEETRVKKMNGRRKRVVYTRRGYALWRKT